MAFDGGVMKDVIFTREMVEIDGEPYTEMFACKIEQTEKGVTFERSLRGFARTTQLGYAAVVTCRDGLDLRHPVTINRFGDDGLFMT